MAIGEQLHKKLSKQYEPSSMINGSFKGFDLAFKTNEQGTPVLLFIGKKDAQGRIKGERYSRTFITDEEGKVVKDHWDLKGKV